MFKHIVAYYHKEGCLEISIQPMDKKSNFKQQSDEIFMYGFCNVCQHPVTPEKVVCNTLFEYSFARLLEQYFYNGELRNIDHLDHSRTTCTHRVHREISRIFIYKGIRITFTFFELDVYNVEVLHLKRQDTSATFQRVIYKGI